jgi:nitrogenase molybdenum-iron protein alpha/beta subunit
MTAQYMEKEFAMPFLSKTPMGIVDTGDFLREVASLLKSQNFPGPFALSGIPPSVSSKEVPSNGVIDSLISPSDGAGVKSTSSQAPSAKVEISRCNASFTATFEGTSFEDTEGGMTLSAKGATATQYSDIEAYIENQARFISQSAWFSRSIDCQNLTGKKAFVFGDATHAASMTKILAREMGLRVCCAGTYCSHDADWFREEVESFCDEILITDDHTKVKEKISSLEPSVLFGTQMERHIGKRYDIPCGVISAPVHIQNFPLGYKPFLGYEGTNQIADLVYNSFTLGMEDHLLEIFGGHDTNNSQFEKLNLKEEQSLAVWTEEGLAELRKIPGFVRGKIKRKTETFAQNKGIKEISLEVLYAAKESAGA